MKLINNDCLIAMKELPDNSIDMVLTDAPYGTTACKWDNVIPFEPMWKELKRITKNNGAICLFGSEPFSSHLRLSNIKMFKYDWIWEKSKASNFLHAPNMPLKVVENIIIFSMGSIGHVNLLGSKRLLYNPQGTIEGKKVIKRKKNTSELKYHRDSQTQHTTGYKCKKENYPTTILDFKSENGLHPTQKPVALLEYLIKTYTLENETVLDFTMGSGSTGVACKNLNRNFIGIEKDKTYFEIAKKRINEHKVQNELL